jgi:ABC-type transport system substrate-binding protein
MLCASVLMGCSGDGSSSADPKTEVATVKPTAGGHLVYGLEADPNGLDPTRNGWDPSGYQLANALFDPIAAFDADGRVQPYLAQSLTPSADYLNWSIKLRPGVLFSNGDPLNADAVVGFLNALRTSAITGPAIKIISDVRALDPMTVQITSSRPWASLPVQMAGQGGYVASPKQVNDPEGTSKPVGTGPFTLRKWEVNKRFELVKNPRYWRSGLPYLDAVDFVVEPEGVRRIGMVEHGELDLTSVTGLWDLKALDDAVARSASSSSRLSVESSAGDTDITTIMFNTAKAPLNDIRVRRAIASATDVSALAAQNGWSLDGIAQGPIDRTSRFFSPASYPPHNLDTARSLLRDYLSDPRVRNRPRQVAFTLTAPNSGAEFVHDLVAQWAEAGIRAEVSLTDEKQLPRLAVLGQFDAMVWRYFSVPDPDLLWHFFVDDTISPDPSGISINFPRLHSPEITAAMNDGRASADPAARVRAYARAQAGFAEQLPYLWLQTSPWRVVSASRVRDAHNVTLSDGASALGLMDGTYRLTETWIAH